MQFADEAFDILDFTADEKYNVFKCTAAMMHMGNMTKDFVPVGKKEQAESRSRMAPLASSVSSIAHGIYQGT